MGELTQFGKGSKEFHRYENQQWGQTKEEFFALCRLGRLQTRLSVKCTAFLLYYPRTPSPARHVYHRVKLTAYTRNYTSELSTSFVYHYISSVVNTKPVRLFSLVFSSAKTCMPGGWD